ncbi:MAG: hypothetical protein COB14_07660 [Alphaproteobacteria bacterium]|nr:MAG: hypothetical protein COB14_07660 [Alphaproteobacteria bacterium]
MSLMFRVLSYQRTVLRLFFLLSLVSLPSLSYAQSDVSAKPYEYKATTVDECIQEKACFWHHFLLAIQVSPIERKVSENINIKKWTRPIRFIRAGQAVGISGDVVKNYLQQLQPFVSQNISFDKEYNLAIIFSDHIESDLSGSYSKIFTNAFGRNVPLEAYRLDQKKRG